MVYIIVVTIVEFVYIVYQDFLNRREREKLQMKLMSKDVNEYKEATEPKPKPAKSVESPYKSMEEVDTEKLMNADDKLRV